MAGRPVAAHSVTFDVKSGYIGIDRETVGHAFKRHDHTPSFATDIKVGQDVILTVQKKGASKGMDIANDISIQTPEGTGKGGLGKGQGKRI